MAMHLKEFGYEYIVVDIEWYSNDAGTKRKEFQYIPFGDDVMDDFTLSLLTNKELLVLLSEDFRGEQLRRSDGEADWKNTSTKTGIITAALFNLSDTDREICLNMEELSGQEPDKDSYEFTELWSGDVLHSGKEALTVVVPAHGTKVFSVR